MLLGNYAELNAPMPKGMQFLPYSRKSKVYEISVALFDNCNLCCSFCFSKRKDNKIDRERILSMPYELMKHVLVDIKKYGIEILNVRSWGGELFADFIDDSVFSVYKEYVDTYRKICQEQCPNVKLQFHWLSNGVWTKWERVKDLLDYSNATLSFSYDPNGRFSNEKQIEQLFENIHKFDAYHNTISITLTKDNINSYINGDKWFESLGNDYKVDANYYWANRDWEKHIPTDEDLYRFFMWGLENKKYNIDIIELIAKSGVNVGAERYCNCLFTAQYNHGVYTKDCVKRTSILDPKRFYGDVADQVNEDNCTAIKNNILLNKRKCLLCSYYGKCSLGCMGSMIFDGYKMSKECPYLRVMKYIEQDKEKFLKEINEWKDKEKKDADYRTSLRQC